MWPCERSIIDGSTPRVRATEPSKLVRMIFRWASALVMMADVRWPIPAEQSRTSMRPRVVCASLAFASSESSGARMAAGGDPVGHGSQSILTPGAEHQGGATARQLHCKSCAKTRTGASDQTGLALPIGVGIGGAHPRAGCAARRHICGLVHGRRAGTKSRHSGEAQGSCGDQQQREGDGHARRAAHWHAEARALSWRGWKARTLRACAFVMIEGGCTRGSPTSLGAHDENS
eukprot:scaffold14737_cov68-Phaeocystis_antarctica.AAC.14